ncbi:hypothetical protein H0Z60_12595 [Ectothiorhodospiraceae bacterium WFHF3C12]|nr:hypothetical protein [Ectothiorhodospiraceae bacterium WFHF3C12]
MVGVLRRCFPESASLARVFWLYGVIPSNVLWILLLWSYAPPTATPLVAVLAVALIVYTGWIVAAIWATADNVHKPLYGVLARWITVAWALNTLLSLAFLMLDLTARTAG